ncbi:unnamed protein product [Rangifer tarandus platyrhynchus]|uniref:Uncharacterized protein n=1 Tax=Rangifer tarandus platyrhynchus TaxID=3082113 RepID=A0AC59YAZ0_RANTA
MMVPLAGVPFPSEVQVAGGGARREEGQLTSSCLTLPGLPTHTPCSELCLVLGAVLVLGMQRTLAFKDGDDAQESGSSGSPAFG